MSDDKNPPLRIPESPDDAVAFVEEDTDRDETVDRRKEILFERKSA